MVLPTLLYGCETWTCYRRHLKKLDQFHLRRLLGISWEDRVTNQEVLRRSSMPGVEVLIMKAQLRWTGHVMRMEDSCLPKQICSELAHGTRKQGGQTKRYKDSSCSRWQRLEAGNSQRSPSLGGKATDTARHQTPSQDRAEGQARKERKAKPGKSGRPSQLLPLPARCVDASVHGSLIGGHTRGATDVVVALRRTSMMMMVF